MFYTRKFFLNSMELRRSLRVGSRVIVDLIVLDNEAAAADPMG